MNIAQTNKLLQTRRSIFPDCYNQEELSEEEIKLMLENANWAPTHRKTQPWRFVVFKGKGMDRLSDELIRQYLSITPEEKQSDFKIAKTQKKIAKSAAIIAIVLDPNPELLPEWEEVASVAMAVQNMYLTCTALKVGCYWSSPKTCKNLNKFLELEEGQKCLGLMYLGKYDLEQSFPERERTPIQQKVRWER